MTKYLLSLRYPNYIGTWDEMYVADNMSTPSLLLATCVSVRLVPPKEFFNSTPEWMICWIRAGVYSLWVWYNMPWRCMYKVSVTLTALCDTFGVWLSFSHHHSSTLDYTITLLTHQVTSRLLASREPNKIHGKSLENVENFSGQLLNVHYWKPVAEEGGRQCIYNWYTPVRMPFHSPFPTQHTRQPHDSQPGWRAGESRSLGPRVLK